MEPCRLLSVLYCYPRLRIKLTVSLLSAGVSFARRSLQIVDLPRRRLGCSFGAAIIGAAELDPV
jgi:hypothetical protein